MKVENIKDYILVTSDENSFEDFYANFQKKHSLFKEKHLIVKILDTINIAKQNILLFLNNSQEHQQRGTSFVIVCKDVDVDDFPETLNIVPTLIEAEDVIEMENIQRELGF